MIFVVVHTMRVLLPFLLLSSVLAQHAHAQEENALPWVQTPSPWDTAPQFPGGAQAWQQYLNDSLHYPPQDLQAGRHGHVLATIHVDTLGRITHVRIVNGVPGATGMARETERLLLTMPPWQPATKGGRPVPAELHLAVPFTRPTHARPRTPGRPATQKP